MKTCLNLFLLKNSVLTNVSVLQLGTFGGGKDDFEFQVNGRRAESSVSTAI
jgi:hypothetical protein